MSQSKSDLEIVDKYVHKLITLAEKIGMRKALIEVHGYAKVKNFLEK